MTQFHDSPISFDLPMAGRTVILSDLGSISSFPTSACAASRAKLTRRQRRPTLASALKQAGKAGVPVKAATLGSDGVKLEFGESGQATDINPWDEVLRREPH
jgi:hypothetical protein